MKNYIKNKIFLKKKLGQYLLIDKLIINNIIKLMDIKIDDNIIEIGPGIGNITKYLLKYVRKITAIEIDNNFCNKLSNDLYFKNKLFLINKNIIKINLIKYLNNINLIRIFGNIPYYITTPIIFNLFKYVNNIYDIHIMVQKEVGYRLIAKPNTKLYGRLSIMAQYLYNISLLLNVPKESFNPIPKVNSVFIKLTPNKCKKYYTKDIKLLNTILIEAFSMRRKIISNSLKKFFTINNLISLDVDPYDRAENLSIEQYCKLSNKIN